MRAARNEMRAAAEHPARAHPRHVGLATAPCPGPHPHRRRRIRLRVPASWQDARIESEVKARLVEEKSANLTRLGVVSRQAVVRLTGTVSSEEQKALAERVAKSVGGVRRVVNALDVRPAPG